MTVEYKMSLDEYNSIIHDEVMKLRKQFPGLEPYLPENLHADIDPMGIILRLRFCVGKNIILTEYTNSPRSWNDIINSELLSSTQEMNQLVTGVSLYNMINPTYLIGGPAHFGKYTVYSSKHVPDDVIICSHKTAYELNRRGIDDRF